MTAGAGQPALRAQHLSKSYHSPVLRDLDMGIEPGQVRCHHGPSGSGKSTLLHCLSGMDRPSAGSVLLGGTEITSLSEKELAVLRLTRFGFIFQRAHLMTTLCLHRTTSSCPGSWQVYARAPRSRRVERS